MNVEDIFIIIDNSCNKLFDFSAFKSFDIDFDCFFFSFFDNLDSFSSNRSLSFGNKSDLLGFFIVEKNSLIDDSTIHCDNFVLSSSCFVSSFDSSDWFSFDYRNNLFSNSYHTLEFLSLNNSGDFVCVDNCLTELIGLLNFLCSFNGLTL